MAYMRARLQIARDILAALQQRHKVLLEQGGGVQQEQPAVSSSVADTNQHPLFNAWMEMEQVGKD